MPIEAVVSSSPCLAFEQATLTGQLRSWLDDLHGDHGHRWWWVVPTSRRRRQMIRFATSENNRAVLTPRIVTLDLLRQHLASYSLAQLEVLGNTGRLLRVAKAWQQAMRPASPATLGKILQLDLAAQEWRASAGTMPADHPHSKFIGEFQRLLELDHCQDGPGQMRQLAGDIDRHDGPLAQLLQQQSGGFLFDGFHRFSDVELELISAIGRWARVRLWLVGGPEQAFHGNVHKALERLNLKSPEVDGREVSGSLASIGRSLFGGTADASKVAPVELLEATSLEDEVDSVARLIKSSAREWGGRGRLADIAVVVPEDSYVPALAASLSAAGIAHSLAAESFALCESRPARLLLAAMRLVRHGWPVNALFDFLRQPLVYRGLQENDLLEQLREHSPRNVIKLDYSKWICHWRQIIERIAADEAETESDAIEAGRFDRLRGLIDSICKCLEPVRDFETALSAGEEPAKLIAACASLMERVGAAAWLSPRDPQAWEVTTPRDWEIDQLAFANLKDVFEELASTPAGDFPLDADGRIDVEMTMRLALAAESFRTSADDDAGVQILRPLAIRGARFRVVFVLGLTEGKYPSETSEVALDLDPNSDSARRKQEQFWNQQYLFTQFFEAASKKLILCRPLRAGDVDLIESPFLRAVRRALGTLAAPRVPAAAIDASRAARCFAVNGQSQVLDAWKKSKSQGKPLQIRDWAKQLLALRYPAEKRFSATALELYASCPFLHFATKTLHLSELEPDLTSRDIGSFIHRVLHSYFEQMRRDLKVGQGARLPAFSSDSARQRLLDSFEEEWRKTPGEPSLRHDFEKALCDIIVNVGNHFQAQGFSQVAAELTFDTMIGKDATKLPVWLKATIDRIDRDSQDRELIGDYKSGRVAGGNKLVDRVKHGRSLQLPLYGALREKETGNDVCHGVYIQLSHKLESEPDKPEAFLTHIGNGLKLGRKTPVDFAPDEAVKLAIEIVGRIRAGRIPLTEFDADSKDPACAAYCAARHACRQPKGYS